MKRLAWLLRRHTAALAGGLGLALACAALALQALVVQPLMRQQTLAPQATQAAARAAATQQMAQALAQADSPRARLDAFYTHFEGYEQLPQQLGRVHAIAHRLGLEVKRADYRLEAPAERKLGRYHMTLPLQGSYLASRAFITTVLRELPGVAVQQVQFQRENVAEGQVTAQVGLVFYLRK